MDAVDVPVIERREGLLRAARHRPDERGVVGFADPALRHPLRAPVAPVSAGAIRGAQGQRPALEPRAEHDVGLGREHVVGRLDPADDRAQVVHVAGPDLEDVVRLAGDVVALLDLGDRREVGASGRSRSCPAPGSPR